MNKHTASYRGLTFRRTSMTRTYTHVVLAPGSLSGDRATAEKWARERWNQNLAYYTELAGGDHKLSREFPALYTPERIADDIKKALEWVAQGEDGHVADAMAFFDARRRKTGTIDGDVYYAVVRWSSRRDLAETEARKHPGAVVVEVTLS